MRKVLKKFGPLTYFRVKGRHKNFLSVWLTGSEGAFGWEWGTDGEPSNPAFCVRVAHFNLFSYESFEVGGYTLFILGFWVIS
jgi:hypothetical protein